MPTKSLSLDQIDQLAASLAQGNHLTPAAAKTLLATLRHREAESQAQANLLGTLCEELDKIYLGLKDPADPGHAAKHFASVAREAANRVRRRHNLRAL